MSRGTFYSHNKVGETFSFQTNSSSATTFDPVVSFLSGSDRVSWDLGDGNGYLAGNGQFYTYSDSGTTKTVTVRTNDLDRLYLVQFSLDNIVGNLDLSKLSNLGGAFTVSNNSSLTGITHTYSPQTFTAYNFSNCDIPGNHDVSMFPNLGGTFNAGNNSSLTGITHTASTQVFTSYSFSQCDITGNHDMSMFTSLGGSFNAGNNSNLTGITHAGSSEVFTSYGVANCNLTDSLDLSMFPNLGGSFQVNNNSNLTEIIHTGSSQVFSLYAVQSCDLSGDLDVSMLSGGCGTFQANNNSSLTGITPTKFTTFNASSCDLTGTLDLSLSDELEMKVKVSDNPNLTDILFPVTTQTFYDNFSASGNKAFNLESCNLGFVDFNPLSGATMDVNSTYGATIYLQNNGMDQDLVNQVLISFSSLTSNNFTRWSGVTLDISGTNAAPGASGEAAISYLTGASVEWSITYS